MLFIISIILALILKATAAPPLLLPPNPKKLHLQYPGGPWISPGDNLPREDTRDPPNLSAQGLSSNKTYIILFIDLDVILHETTATAILHWYQPDLIPDVDNENEAGDLKPNKTSGKPATYIGPRPPKGTKHRYVFLLFEQPPDYKFPECFGHIFPETVKARAGFDVMQFVGVAGLGPLVAGNWFWGGDFYSSTSTGSVTRTGTETGSVTASSTGTVGITTSMRVAPCEVTGWYGTGNGYGWGYGYQDSMQMVL